MVKREEREAREAAGTDDNNVAGTADAIKFAPGTPEYDRFKAAGVAGYAAKDTPVNPKSIAANINTGSNRLIDVKNKQERYQNYNTDRKQEDSTNKPRYPRQDEKKEEKKIYVDPIKLARQVKENVNIQKDLEEEIRKSLGGGENERGNNGYDRSGADFGSDTFDNFAGDQSSGSTDDNRSKTQDSRLPGQFNTGNADFGSNNGFDSIKTNSTAATKKALS